MHPSKPAQISVLVLLELLQDGFVFRLAVEPKHKWDSKRWQCHDGECQPVSHMRRELPVKVSHWHNSTLPWLSGVGKLDLLTVLRCPVGNIGTCEVEEAKCQRPDDNGVSDIAAGSKPVELETQKTTGDLEVCRIKGVVGQLNVQCRTPTNIVDVVVNNDVFALNKKFVEYPLLYK